MSKEDELLTHEEQILEEYWRDIIEHIKTDLAYIWSKQAQKDIEGIGGELDKLKHILRRFYNSDRESYQKIRKTIETFLEDLEQIEASRQWIKRIRDDLRQIILGIERERETIRQRTLEENKRKKELHGELVKLYLYYLRRLQSDKIRLEDLLSDSDIEERMNNNTHYLMQYCDHLSSEHLEFREIKSLLHQLQSVLHRLFNEITQPHDQAEAIKQIEVLIREIISLSEQSPLLNKDYNMSDGMQLEKWGCENKEWYPLLCSHMGDLRKIVDQHGAGMLRVSINAVFGTDESPGIRFFQEQASRPEVWSLLVDSIDRIGKGASEDMRDYFFTVHLVSVFGGELKGFRSSTVYPGIPIFQKGIEAAQWKGLIDLAVADTKAFFFPLGLAVVFGGENNGRVYPGIEFFKRNFLNP